MEGTGNLESHGGNRAETVNLLWGELSLLLKSGKALGFLRREDARRKPFLPAGRQESHRCSSMQPTAASL